MYMAQKAKKKSKMRHAEYYDMQKTFDDLYADRAKIESNMNRLIEVRTKLQNKIRRATPAEKEPLREEKAGVTARITELRKQLKMNKAIEERSVKIQEKTDMFYANEIAAKQAEQQKIRERQRGGWER